MRYDDRNEYYDYNEEMCFAASNCKSFKRRRNVNSFNMSDYRACDNCIHYTADRRCCVNKQDTEVFRNSLW